MNGSDKAEEGPSSSHINNGFQSQAASTKPRPRGIKGHCMRFWWVHLLILILIVVIVVPCILLVAVPKIAQQKLDAATLQIDGITVSNTTNTTLVMSINSTILSDGSVSATIDGFNGTMYLADLDPPLAFASINFPQTTSASVSTVNVSQQLTVTDELTTFNKLLFEQPNVNVTISGDTYVHVSGIAKAYPVTFSKTVTLAGVNGFPGLEAQNIMIASTQYDNFNATAIIPNPSLFSIEAGNLTFHTYFNNTEVGTSYILNAVLRPGNNTFFMWADINNTLILPALQSGPYCKDGVLPFQLSGKTVTNHGQSLNYLAGALGARNATVMLPIAAAVKQDLGFDLHC